MVKNFWIYIHSDFIIPVNVTGKYSKSSFKIRRWQRYCLHNLVPFRFLLSMLISVSCQLCYILCCLQKKVKTKTKEESKGMYFKDLVSCLELFLQCFKEMENKVYKVLSEWKFDNLKEKFKGKAIFRLWIYMYLNVHF